MEPERAEAAHLEPEVGPELESQGSSSIDAPTELRHELNALKELFCEEIKQLKTEMRTLLSQAHIAAMAAQSMSTDHVPRTRSRVMIVEPPKVEASSARTMNKHTTASPSTLLGGGPLSDDGDTVVPIGTSSNSPKSRHEASPSGSLNIPLPPLPPPAHASVAAEPAALPPRGPPPLHRRASALRRQPYRPTIDEIVEPPSADTPSSPQEKSVTPSEIGSASREQHLGQFFDMLSQSGADGRESNVAATNDALRLLANSLRGGSVTSTYSRHAASPVDYGHLRRPHRHSVAPSYMRSDPGDLMDINEDESAAVSDEPPNPLATPGNPEASSGHPPVKHIHATRAAQAAVRRKGLSVDSPLALALDVFLVLSATLTFIMSFYAVVNGLQQTDGGFELVQGCLIGSQLYYCLWVVTRFFVQHRRGDWEVVEGLHDIRQHYLSLWFRFDFAIAFPLDFMFLGWEPRGFFWCQLLRQLLRFVRVDSLRVSGNPLISERRWITMLMLTMAIIMSSHACAVVFMHLDDRSYIDGLYFATTTMTSVGYGDLATGNSYSSRIFTIFVEFLGIAMVAAVTGFAALLFTSTDALKAAVEEKKLMLASMLDYYQVPWPVQAEIISMFPTVIDAENEARFKQLTQELPNFLVDKIEGYTRAKALSCAIPLFNDCPIEVLLEVTKRLVHRFHQPNEAIIIAGEDGYEMYFLVRGVADVVIHTPDGSHLVVATLRSGSFFGEMALVSENVKRTASVIAVSPSELLVLAKHNFEELSSEYASVKGVFNTVIEAARARAAAAKK